MFSLLITDTGFKVLKPAVLSYLLGFSFFQVAFSLKSLFYFYTFKNPSCRPPITSDGLCAYTLCFSRIYSVPLEVKWTGASNAHGRKRYSEAKSSVSAGPSSFPSFILQVRFHLHYNIEDLQWLPKVNWFDNWDIVNAANHLPFHGSPLAIMTTPVSPSLTLPSFSFLSVGGLRVRPQACLLQN